MKFNTRFSWEFCRILLEEGVFMDDVLQNKAAIIERCLTRIREEYQGSKDQLETNYTKQDSIILSLLRAAEASIDSAMHVVRVKQLGVPQQFREAVCSA
jgi:uncharacterized protein YutE (UPF0331/DUF86 family)